MPLLRKETGDRKSIVAEVTRLPAQNVMSTVQTIPVTQMLPRLNRAEKIWLICKLSLNTLARNSVMIVLGGIVVDTPLTHGVTMKRFWYGSALAVVFSLSMNVGEVCAQPVPGLGPSGASPTVSPYLNLLRNNGNGGSPALNYFTLVRPQVQSNQALLGLTYDQSQNRQAIGDLTGVSFTGHPTQFLNYGGYFLNRGSNTGGTSMFGGSSLNSAGGMGSMGSMGGTGGGWNGSGAWNGSGGGMGGMGGVGGVGGGLRGGGGMPGGVGGGGFGR
jgi:hypothetical protein